MSREQVVIAGAGLSGLCAGAYLAREGFAPLILEKGSVCGGLVQGFSREGFYFDAGPRAIGDSGIIGPMLADLGIDVPMVRGLVSTGIEGEIVHHDDRSGIDAWLDSLNRLYPSRSKDLASLGKKIRTACAMARDLRKLPNPYFFNPLADPAYLFGKFIPWLPSFLSVALRTGLDRRPVESILDGITEDRSLKDAVCQHFFKGTPWHFALGYFENFQDYLYPLGGTGAFAKALEGFITERGGRIEYECEAAKILPAERTLFDSRGREYEWRELLWAADLCSLYGRLDMRGMHPARVGAVEREAQRYAAAQAGESVFTLFIAVDESPARFAEVSRGHFIHSLKRAGLGELHRSALADLKANFGSVGEGELSKWIEELCALNSYEISIPVLTDPSLAPPGKTGIVASILFDGELCEIAEKAGRLDELKEKTAECMLKNLDEGLYPGLRAKILFALPATPLSLEHRFNTRCGAITGWSLEEPAPVSASLLTVSGCASTSMPHVWKAGQWSYSPSGAPVAILTGRIAAGKIARKLRAVL